MNMIHRISGIYSPVESSICRNQVPTPPVSNIQFSRGTSARVLNERQKCHSSSIIKQRPVLLVIELRTLIILHVCHRFLPEIRVATAGAYEFSNRLKYVFPMFENRETRFIHRRWHVFLLNASEYFYNIEISPAEINPRKKKKNPLISLLDK